MEGTAEDWATESLPAAREADQDPAPGQRIKPEPSSATPTTRSLPAAMQRLYQAATRLARALTGSLRPE